MTIHLEISVDEIPLNADQKNALKNLDKHSLAFSEGDIDRLWKIAFWNYEKTVNWKVIDLLQKE